MNVHFETDADGFLSQECPSCRRRFKVLFGEGGDGTLSFCPYCRHTGEDNWLTPEQLNYVQTVATEAVVRPQLEQLKRQIASSASDMVDIQVTEEIAETAMPPVETIDDFASIHFACCAETIKAEACESYYCIICGKAQEVTMDKGRIFLSHKGSDKKMVLEYKEVLEELGYKPWLDDEAMPAGTPLERGLLEGMQESCAVIFFVTADFKDTGFLETEIDYAIAEKRKRQGEFAIITLILHDSGGALDAESVVPPLLKPYVWKQPKSQLQALIEILRALSKNTTDDPANVSTLSANLISRKKIDSDFSEDAKSILKAAAKGEGTVICGRTIGGVRVSAGGESMMEDDGPREAARWEAAVEELQRLRCLKDVGHQGEVFELTKAGWDMADSLLDG